MNRNMKLIHLLDSDDELPDDYIDIPHIPAYQNDHRFDTIEFNWIGDKPKQINKEANIKEKESSVLKNKASSTQCLLLKRGVLKKQDINCLQAVANSITCDTLLWLANFMIFKDLQSSYNFLTSCLVTR